MCIRDRIIAYTPCITHGLLGGMKESLKEAKEAVSSGYWSLYRYNPTMVEKNKKPMTLDYKKPDFSAMPDFMRKQVRFSSLENANPNLAKALFEKTVQDAKKMCIRDRSWSSTVRRSYTSIDWKLRCDHARL